MIFTDSTAKHEQLTNPNIINSIFFVSRFKQIYFETQTLFKKKLSHLKYRKCKPGGIILIPRNFSPAFQLCRSIPISVPTGTFRNTNVAPSLNNLNATSGDISDVLGGEEDDIDEDATFLELHG